VIAYFFQQTALRPQMPPRIFPLFSTGRNRIAQKTKAALRQPWFDPQLVNSTLDYGFTGGGFLPVVSTLVSVVTVVSPPGVDVVVVVFCLVSLPPQPIAATPRIEAIAIVVMLFIANSPGVEGN
jgi:hypothetical protein